MTKYLITNYSNINLWCDKTLHTLKLLYSMRQSKKDLHLLAETKLGDFRRITYYDDVVFVDWFNNNEDKLIDWTELKEGQKFQMCDRNITSNATCLGFNKYGFLTYREEGKSIDFCITGNKLVLLIEN